MLSSNDQIKFVSTEDGIHLDGSILWFDAQATRELSFLSSPYAITSAIQSQVLTTSESAEILAALYSKPEGLIGQFNHPIRIGELTLELIPSGVGLAGANLFIEKGDRTILYAPQLQLEQLPIARHLQLRQADILILGATEPYSASKVSYESYQHSLAAIIRASAESSEPLTIFASSSPSAQELISLCNALGVEPSVSKELEKVNEIYRSHGVKLDCADKQSGSRSHIKILHQRKAKRYTKKYAEEKTLYLSSSVEALEKAKSELAWIDYHKLLPVSSSGISYKPVIDTVAPKQLYFFGSYASSYQKAFSSLAPETNTLYPRHLPSLF